MKILKLNHTSLKKLKDDVEKIGPDCIVGSIGDLKKIGLNQGSEVLGVKIKPDSEEISLSQFKIRQELDEYVKELLGDNITLNRLNSHILKGKKEDTDRLMLGRGSSVYGCKVVYD